ncbi:MAG: hypothetical protein A2Y25_08250 [Candidatus Melainabacteria bacterium GWF2_37_15]|nr:MAG: hypothetical protein A2Y25_08250 [Candidatus Melainabacteria bacterium GWF2_37_15]
MCKNKLFLALSFLVLFFLWSSTYTAVTIALNAFSPGGLALFRFSIASVLLFIVSRRCKINYPDKKDLPLILVCGFLGVSVYNLILFYGQKNIPVAVSSILLNTYPIFVATFSFLIFKEYINIFKLIGIIISFIGILIVSGGEVFEFSFNSSILLILLAAIIVSLFDIEQKQLMKKYTPLELTCYFIWSGTLFLLVFSGTLIHDFMGIDFNSFASAVYLGVFPSVIATLIWSKLILKYSITSLSCCCYITPFFAMLLAFLFLHQIPKSSVITGSIIVITGLLISNFSKNLKVKL